MYCRQCGIQIGDHDSFCFNCGTPVDDCKTSGFTASGPEPVNPAPKPQKPKIKLFAARKTGNSTRESGKAKSPVFRILVGILVIGFLYFLLCGPAQHLADRLADKHHDKISGIERSDEPEEVSVQTVEQTIASYEGFELVLHSIRRSNHYDSAWLNFSVVNISSHNYQYGCYFTMGDYTVSGITSHAFRTDNSYDHEPREFTDSIDPGTLALVGVTQLNEITVTCWLKDVGDLDDPEDDVFIGTFPPVTIEGDFSPKYSNYDKCRHVLLDNEDCSMTVVGYNNTSRYWTDVYILMENKGIQALTFHQAIGQEFYQVDPPIPGGKSIVEIQMNDTSGISSKELPDSFCVKDEQGDILYRVDSNFRFDHRGHLESAY